MSDLKRCDKCKKLIQNKKFVNITISDRADVSDFGFFESLDLCPKCGAADIYSLQKMFPGLKNSKRN